MGLDLKYASRSVYTLFELLGNVGGLAGILFPLATQLYSLSLFQSTENMLVDNLYKPSVALDKLALEGRNRLRHRDRSPLKEYLQSCRPKMCRVYCLRTTKVDRFYRKARDRLEKELDLVKLLRRQRLFTLAISSLLDKAHL